MKKVVLIVTLGLMAIGFNACKKDVAPALVQSTDYDGVTTDGKMLIFETVEDYENIMNDLIEEKEVLFSNKLSTLGYNNYFSVERFEVKSDDGENEKMDEFLGQLLNEDGAIQIGDHIFKIDLEAEQVFVIAKENVEDDYADLISGNTENTNISVYNLDQEVLYLVNGEAEEKCGGIGGGAYSCYPNNYNGQIVYEFPGGNVWRLNPGVKFFRAGIYFRLSSLYEIWVFSSESDEDGYKVSNTNNLFTVEIFCKYPGGWYKKRPCSSNSVGGRGYGLYYTSSLASYQKTFYGGTRNLNGYYFFVQGRVRYPNGSVTIASPYGGRNINSPY